MRAYNVVGFEQRTIELRAEPDRRRIIGVVIAYGARATVLAPGGRVVQETFEPGAFGAYVREYRTRLNLQHDREITIATTGAPGQLGQLQLIDTPTELRMIATLPAGAAFDAALQLIAGGDTAQTSVEFRALAEHFAGELRTITAATLPAIGLVDAGAYAGAVEVRHALPVAPRRRRLWL